jgi:hypothetical protein
MSRQTVPYQFIGDERTSLAAVQALWGGPKYIELFNNDAAAWVPGSWYMIDFTAGALTSYGNPGAAILATSALQKQCVGVAVDATAQGAKGRIQIYGKYSGANVTTAGGTQGLFITLQGTGASGRAIVAPAVTAATEYPSLVGFILTTAAANAADVFITSPFRF